MAKTLAQIQAMITAKYDSREIINELADFLETFSPGGGGVQSYIALLEQTGTDAPVATVLLNTFNGEIVWTRESAGNYSGTLINAFTDDKVHIPPFGDFSGDANTYLPIWSGSGAVLGYWTVYLANEDSIGIQVKNPSGVAVDLSTLIGTTKLMLPEIRVYP